MMSRRLLGTALGVAGIALWACPAMLAAHRWLAAIHGRAGGDATKAKAHRMAVRAVSRTLREARAG